MGIEIATTCKNEIIKTGSKNPNWNVDVCYR